MQNNFFLSAIIFLATCNSAQVASSFNSFERSIFQIESEVKDLTSFSSLLNVKQFVELSKKANSNYQNSLDLLSSKKYTKQEKIIAICIMQSLGKKKYLQFIEKNIEYYNSDQIEEYLLLLIIVPEFKQKFTKDEKYYNDLKNLILKINQKNDYFKEMIREVSQH